MEEGEEGEEVKRARHGRHEILRKREREGERGGRKG